MEKVSAVGDKYGTNWERLDSGKMDAPAACFPTNYQPAWCLALARNQEPDPTHPPNACIVSTGHRFVFIPSAPVTCHI